MKFFALETVEVANTDIYFPDAAFVEKYYCPDCGKAYKHKGILQRHLKYECGDKRPFACNFCDYSTKQKQNLKKHLIVKHAGVLV